MTLIFPDILAEDDADVERVGDCPQDGWRKEIEPSLSEAVDGEHVDVAFPVGDTSRVRVLSVRVSRTFMVNVSSQVYEGVTEPDELG